MKRLGIILLYLAVASAASLILLYGFDTSASRMTLASAEFVAGGDRAYPETGRSAARRALELPDDSRRRDDRDAGGWYRFGFAVDPADASLWALVIPAVRMNAEVYLNGVRIGDGGRLEPPVARNIRRPLIFTLPPRLLREGSNQLTIRVIAGPDRISYLGPVHIGPYPSMRAAYQNYYFVRITLVQIISVSVVLIGGMIGVLGFIRRRDQEYAYFSLCTLIWALHSFSYFTVEIPVSDRLWDYFVFVSIGFFALLGGIVYVHRYLGLHLPAIERPAMLGGGVMAVVMLLLPGQWFYLFSYYVWHPLSQLAGSYGLLRMLHAARARGSIELHIIASSGAVLVGYALHDLLLVFGLLDWGRGYIIQYSMPFVLILFCVMLMRRFVQSIDAVEKMKNDLERRVEERRLELEEAYAKLHESERKRLLAEERDRIMRDMHDGVGGQLVSAITLARNKGADPAALGPVLENALQDLRLMIDSLDGDAHDLPVLLGQFRQRVEPALRARGIRLSWQVDSIDGVEDFGAAQALHVLRILQEFVTNSLRHSGASGIELRAENDGERIVIEINDNGRGIDGASPGRGINNMRERAAAIGAELQLDSGNAGTRLRLFLAG